MVFFQLNVKKRFKHIKMKKKESLFNEISLARKNYLAKAKQLTEQQAQWKPSDEVWNAVQITEHLFWAEQGGILSIWKALQAKKEGKVVWEGERIHAGKTMETIIEQTWKDKEIVPAVAAPVGNRSAGQPGHARCGQHDTIESHAAGARKRRSLRQPFGRGNQTRPR